jgi:hypothetical protein
MSRAADEHIEALLALSEKERAEAAARLIASLDGPADQDAGAAWAREIERRALLAKDAEDIEWEDGLRAAREKLRKP